MNVKVKVYYVYIFYKKHIYYRIYFIKGMLITCTMQPRTQGPRV
jgi:hypothetical protein